MEYDHRNPSGEVLLLNKFMAHEASREEIQFLVDSKVGHLKRHIKQALLNGGHKNPAGDSLDEMPLPPAFETFVQDERAFLIRSYVKQEIYNTHREAIEKLYTMQYGVECAHSGVTRDECVLDYGCCWAPDMFEAGEVSLDVVDGDEAANKLEDSYAAKDYYNAHTYKAIKSDL